MIRILLQIALLPLLSLLAAGQASAQARLWEEPGPCDRECLKGIADTYILAMVANDAAAAPFSADVKYSVTSAVS